MPKSQPSELELNRRNQPERRGEDRRKQDAQIAVERRAGSRRTKVQRRRQIDPTTCEREYSGEEIEFMHALDAYKHTSGRMFPTCSEILEVIRGLGYVRLSPDQATPIQLEAMPEAETPDAELL